jgi:RNA polymerase sigma-70 factor, ECF subfamily
VDTAAPNSDDAVLPNPVATPVSLPETDDTGVAPGLIKEWWTGAEAESCGLTLEEFGNVLGKVGARHNFGVATGIQAGRKQQEAFFRGLHLGELALAHGCARGKNAAWEKFVRRYRSMLTEAGSAIAGSASLGEELADSLYAELYGLREADGERCSPFASYSGRGSLAGWLRTTLVQRFRDHHRRTHRESPLEDGDCPAPQTEAAPARQLNGLRDAVQRTLGDLAAQDRFLLAAYFLDGRTLFEIARILGVHEATISRRLKRLVGDARKKLLKNLERGGLSRRQAEEALGADPRDIEINLRALLQSSRPEAFQDKSADCASASR